MDLKDSPTFEELKEIFRKYFTIPTYDTDCSNKFALISLVCYLTEQLKQKNPDTTHWKVLYQLDKNGNCGVREEWLKGLAVVCSEFSYGCTVFPTFGLTDKEIPKKIVEMLRNWLPF